MTDDTGSITLGPHDKSQLNVRVSDKTFGQLEALKRFDKRYGYGDLVETAVEQLWHSSTAIEAGLLRAADYNAMDVYLDRWKAEGNADYALHLFRAHFGQLWHSLREACARLERAGIELPLV